ncbi:KxYKxGKxW signal peptide domain-containing protein [Lactobacillus paracasei subsp. tolerans]|nr:KxYKxGKxW signal peptide domain-containing protein [Lacticaseibacillus paracasei subsp. tolerans]
MEIKKHFKLYKAGKISSTKQEKDSTSLQDRVSDATDKTKEAFSKGAKKSKETLSDSVDKVTSDNKSSRVN